MALIKIDYVLILDSFIFIITLIINNYKVGDKINVYFIIDK